MDIFSMLESDTIYEVSKKSSNRDILLGVYSDYAICTGGIASLKNPDKMNKIGYYHVKHIKNNKPSYLDFNAKINDISAVEKEPTYACRPILKPEIFKELPREVISLKYPEKIIVGEFPQTAVHKELSHELETKMMMGKLLKTGKEYIYCYNYDYRNDNFLFDFTPEYYYKGKKYIRQKVLSPNSNDLKKYAYLSNGIYVTNGDYVWIEVEPLIFKKLEDDWISEKCLFSGFPVTHKNLKEDFNYEETYLYQYLNSIFVKNIMPSGYEFLKKSKTEKLKHDELLIFISYFINTDETLLGEMFETLKSYDEGYIELFKSGWIDKDFSRASTMSKFNMRERLKF